MIGKKKLFFKVRIGIASTLAVLGFALPLHAQVYVGGELTADATFSPINNPYIVTQDLIVNQGVTLTIEPGVELLFEYGTSLVSNGIFISKGTTEKPILFNPKNNLPFSGQWNGIVINGAKSSLDENGNYIGGSVISHAVLSKASYSVTLGSSTSLLIENVKFERCSFGVFIMESSYNTIRNCTFAGADFGIFIASGYFSVFNTISGNSISGSSDVGIFINSSADNSYNNYISDNRITSCNIGLHIGNYDRYGSSSNTIVDNYFYNNKDAVKLFQDSTTIRYNYFIFNGTGITCWYSKHNTINQNLFDNNSFFAITLTAGSSFNNITQNNLCESEGGIWIKSDSGSNSLYNSVLNNSVHGNAARSLLIENYPQGPVQFNNICFNGDYQSFENLSQGIVQAGYNYWAKSSETAIDSLIFDMYDENQRGEAIYKPFLTEPLTSASIIAPRWVIKQKIGSDLLVSWDSVNFSNLDYYAVHFGKTDGITFENRINKGKFTLFNMGDFPISDTIALTSVDFQADGSKDQPEGHESEYAFALLFPYAGPDTAICYNATYTIGDATALNYESLTWTTSGDGHFDYLHTLNAVYNPGIMDLTNGDVFLTLHTVSPEYQASDVTHITFLDAPEAFAGNDTIITKDSTLRLLDATASGYDFLKWTTSGDGTFDVDSLLNPVYFPGPADKVSGKANLVITVFSACGLASDTMILQVIPGFSVNGRVHAGNDLASNTRIVVYRSIKNEIVKMRGDQTTNDGNFAINALAEGEYYLYFVPDKELFPGFAPVYFFDDLHWGNAEKIKVNTDVYDVDIELYKRNIQLPEGEGTVSGFASPASGSNERCTDITVILFNSLMKNVFDWASLSEGGNFRFRNLPYGSYVLAGEKAGIPLFGSRVVWITPQQPVVENIELICTGDTHKFVVPDQPKTSDSPERINIYPNPFTGYLNISNCNEGGCTVKIVNLQNVLAYRNELSPASGVFTLNLVSLPAGLYFAEISKNGVCLLREKIIKM